MLPDSHVQLLNNYQLPFLFLRYACAPTATRSYLTTASVLFLLCFFPFFASLEMSPFRSIFVPFVGVFSFLRVRRRFPPLLDGVYMFRFVTTGWIFDINLCENSIKFNIKRLPKEIPNYPMKRLRSQTATSTAAAVESTHFLAFCVLSLLMHRSTYRSCATARYYIFSGRWLIWRQFLCIPNYPTSCVVSFASTGTCSYTN